MAIQRLFYVRTATVWSLIILKLHDDHISRHRGGPGAIWTSDLYSRSSQVTFGHLRFYNFLQIPNN